MDNAEFSPEKATDLRDLAGEASLTGFFAAGELTHTDFDFLHNGLAFSGVARIRLFLCISIVLSKVYWLLSQTRTAALNCEFSDRMGCRHDQKIEGNLARMAILLDCKFQIDGLQSNPFGRFEEILRRRMALLAKISKLHFERNLAKPTIITRVRFRHFLHYIIGVTFDSRRCLEVACGLFTCVCCYRK